ncbi:uncharacterized protein LOC122320468 [Drosophila ficusphila]|uniref:uncharacterized protein LOC122320468 n=1 Tax=Drosophila ficusphila TaxID=30025 RepID=UPI001C893819|nr:uncharacterized protein LOC122320468 [Drosophila ficusphila]
MSLYLFVGRRGLPKTVHCDNGTNFVGASNRMKEFGERLKAELTGVQRYASEEGVSFAFIPPRAPHFGGLWEGAVKSAKGLLLRTAGRALLTADELTTFLVGVEATLNSRPIGPLSQDPNDGQALTPAHLLIGGPLKAPPEEEAPEK